MCGPQGARHLLDFDGTGGFQLCGCQLGQREFEYALRVLGSDAVGIYMLRKLETTAESGVTELPALVRAVLRFVAVLAVGGDAQETIVNAHCKIILFQAGRSYFNFVVRIRFQNINRRRRIQKITAKHIGNIPVEKLIKKTPDTFSRVHWIILDDVHSFIRLVNKFVVPLVVRQYRI